MKIYFAIGDKKLNVTIIHGLRNGFGKEGMHCTVLNALFKPCPPIHPDQITNQTLRENFESCEKFKLFNSQQAAEEYKEKYLKYAPYTENNQLSFNPGWTDLPIFVVEVGNNVAIKWNNEIGQVDKNSEIKFIQCIYEQETQRINQQEALKDTTPDFLRPH